MTKKNLIAEERIKHGSWLPPWTVMEHTARYEFAANFVTDKHVVDCACGNGVGSRVFLSKNPRSLHGFDVDQEAVNCASRELAQHNVTFKKASALSLPIAEKSADLFISLETIEHIENDSGFIQEVCRVLKPGGRFICSTPNRLITNPGTTLEDSPWNHFHIREYSPKELAYKIEKYFEIEGWYGQNKNNLLKNTVSNWIAKLLGKKSAVLFNQILKCRWFLFSNKTKHRVEPAKIAELYEYIVVVCRHKKAE